MTVSPGSNSDGPMPRSAPNTAVPPARTLRLANRLSEIRRLAAAVEDFASHHQVPGKAAHHITLAADELITNAIEHGAGLDRRRIMVTLRRESDRLVMEIAHRGTAFDPTARSTQPVLDADLDDRPAGGFGIHFAKTLLDGLSYVRRRGMNRLTLTKNL